MRHGAILVLVGAALLAVPALAQEKPLHIPKLGSYRLGDKPARIRERSKECARSPDDCSFVEPASGVEYIALRGTILSARANELVTTVSLPFGLTFGDSLASARRKLPGTQRDWTETSEGRVHHLASSLSLTDGPAKRETFSVELDFTGGRLVRVAYVSMI